MTAPAGAAQGAASGHLEERFRCGCGARRVVFEAARLGEAALPTVSPIFRWR